MARERVAPRPLPRRGAPGPGAAAAPGPPPRPAGGPPPGAAGGGGGGVGGPPGGGGGGGDRVPGADPSPGPDEPAPYAAT